MYIDIIVLVVLIVIVLIYSKRFQTYIFGIGMIDVIFRLLNVINSFLPKGTIKSLINNYIPSSVPNVIDKYIDGIICNILLYAYAAVMILFIYYLLVIFIKRKKI